MASTRTDSELIDLALSHLERFWSEAPAKAAKLPQMAWEDGIEFVSADWSIAESRFSQMVEREDKGQLTTTQAKRLRAAAALRDRHYRHVSAAIDAWIAGE